MEKPSKPSCKSCGNEIPIGLNLTEICVSCLIKPTSKDI